MAIFPTVPLSTVWSNLRKLVVTFRAGLPGQLRAAVPPSASEPRSMFTSGVFQHHHLLATRAAQRLTAGTWVFGREYGCWSRLRSKRVASGPRFTAELTRSVIGPCGPGTCRCALLHKCTVSRERRVRAPLIDVYRACLSQASKQAIREPSVCVECKYWYPSTYLIFIARTTGTF